MTPRNSWTRLIALSLTVFALAIPSIASAAPVPGLGTYHPTEQTDPSPSSPTAGGIDAGFNWGDAALGGAAVLAIAIVGAGGLVMVRSYRQTHVQVRSS
jgi:hypothetical protein